MEYNRNLRLSGGAAIALAVALTMAAYLLASLFQSDQSTPLASVVRLNTATNREVQVTGDTIYYLETGSLHNVATSGKYIWNVGTDIDTQFKTSDYGVATWNRRKLSLLDKKTGSLLFTKNMEEEILSAMIGDRYVVAVIGAENDSKVVLMNHYGTVVDNLTDFKGYTVLDYGFFEGRDLFWIMTLDSTGSVPTCKISTYIPGKRETGSITDSEQVIYQVMFRSSYIAAVGTNYMRLYDYTGAEQTKERTTVYGWYMEAVDKRTTDNPLMLFVPNAQMEDNIEISDVRMIRGSSEQIIHLPVACRQLEAIGNNFYGFSKEYLVKGSFGQKTSTVYKLPVTVDNVIGITTDNTAVITSGGSIYLILMP